MIEKLILKNFQCYKKRTIRFGKITTIVGPSDSGKSAIVRALRWVLLNRPAGMAFIRRGADRCKAQVTTEDNAIIRERSKSQNVYRTREGKYKAFGNNVPQPVAEAVNVCEDNFQKQHDSPYWLNMSPGEVSRALNEVVDLEIIDRTLSNLNRELRKAKLSVSVSRERLQDAKAERKRLAFVDDLKSDLISLESKERDLQEQHDETDGLNKLLARTKDAKEQTTELDKHLTDAEGKYAIAGKAYEKYQKSNEATNHLSSLLENCREWHGKLESVTTELESAESELAEFETCPWCGSEL